MLRSLLAALLLAVAPAAAQVPKSIEDFSGGLNTRNAGVLLQDNESPDLQNVVLDENGGVSRREGSSKINPAALGDGASDVNAVYQLEQSGGNKYCVSFSSTSGYYSTDGCATNTVFVSTLTRNSDVNCDAYGDKLYCVNNQYNFSFNGVNDVQFTAAPSDLNYIRVFHNRCFGAGKDTNPSRLYWSALGNCDSWTTSTDFVDLDAEDGDVITGIGLDLFNRLVVYKKFSSYYVQFDNANPSGRKLINISRSTGAKNHRAIANFDNKQFFLSVGPNGGQPGVYVTDGLLIQEDTAKLRGSLDELRSFASNTGRFTLDTRADWDSGTFDPYAMSTSRDSGFIQSTYTVRELTTSADWSLGSMTRLSTTAVSGSLSLTSTTYSDWHTDTVAGRLSWTPNNSGDWFAITDGVRTNGTGNAELGANITTTQVKLTSGAWSWSHYSYSNQTITDCAAGNSWDCFQFRFIENSGGDYYAVVQDHNNKASIIKRVSSTTTVLARTLAPYTYATSTAHSWRVERTPSGVMVLLIDGVFVASTTADTSITSSARVRIAASGITLGGSTLYQNFYDFYAVQFSSSGWFDTPIFDMSISTPIGGPFTSTGTVNSSEAQINYKIRQSTSPNNDMWTNWVASSDTLRVQMGLRYQQAHVDFYTFSSTKSPHLDAMGVSAASSGTWRSPELFLSNGINSWVAFRPETTITGSGAAITYTVQIATYAGGAASTGTVVVTAGNSIAHSTGAYVIVRATFTVFSASETAKIDAIAFTWVEGSDIRSTTMAVYRNRLHLCGQSAAGPVNDVCYVRDLKGSWVRWVGINARHLNTVGQNFVAGSSSETGGGFMYKLYDTDSDNGGAISSYWESKDLILGNIQNRKSIDRLYVLGSNDATTLTTTVKGDSGLQSTSFSLNLSTGAAFRVVQKPLSATPINGNTFRVRFENNAASKPWSIFGFGLLFRDLGLPIP